MKTLALIFTIAAAATICAVGFFMGYVIGQSAAYEEMSEKLDEMNKRQEAEK